jgi:hypothetical protein
MHVLSSWSHLEFYSMKLFGASYKENYSHDALSATWRSVKIQRWDNRELGQPKSERHLGSKPKSRRGETQSDNFANNFVAQENAMRVQWRLQTAAMRLGCHEALAMIRQQHIGRNWVLIKRVLSHRIHFQRRERGLYQIRYTNGRNIVVLTLN